MQFRRGVKDVPRATTELELIQVDRSTAPAFAHVVRVAYALPIEVEPFLAGITDTGWRAWLALRGAQSALLAARIRQARELGCRWVATETGETRPDQPSHSYRNILRAGFTEQFVIANWRSG